MIETDALIVGAGPAGLFQVFELGLFDIRAHVVDALPHLGGQCIELYPDKPIYDIPGQPFTTGRALVDSLARQAAPFEPTFHLEQEVASLQREADGRWRVGTARPGAPGQEFLAKTVFIAAGVGAFQPRTLKVDGLERFLGTQLFYRLREPQPFAGGHVLIVGGDAPAVEAALRLATIQSDEPAQRPASVTLMHRRDVLDAPPESLARLQAARDEGRIRFVAGQVTGFEEEGGKLARVLVLQSDGSTQPLAANALLVLLGLSPRLGPIAQWGLAMERKQLQVDPATFATSEPGLFAVGDINTYPGKRKLIVSAFHECTLAAFAAAAVVFPDKPVQLQYTTTSPKLHKLLGVPPASGG